MSAAFGGLIRGLVALKNQLNSSTSLWLRFLGPLQIDPKEELKFFTFLIWLRNLLDITISSTGKSGIGIASFLYKFVPVLLLITLALGGGFLYHFIITPSDSPTSRPQRNVIKVEETTQRRGGPFGLNRRRVYKVTYEDANGVIRTDERYSDPTK
ncbi:hypothetical protein OAE33_00580 [Akkermansiaceae bacterium]|nr:hypothetical protein [Akkermansiaceae bacterium]